MSRRKAFVALVVSTAFGVVGVTSAVAGKDDIDKREEKGGAVLPCSLDGVNPAVHPEIFGNPTVAKSYGFVRMRDGTWRVEPNCRR
jgi:hypothetical protein